MMGTKTVMVNGLNLGNLAAPRAQAADSGKSIADLQAAAAKNPAPESYFKLGEALRKANQNEKAAAAYRQALKLRPNYPEATQALTKLK
jgi:cytochrome c-type biogenesis protein CcmH/NrfG